MVTRGRRGCNWPGARSMAGEPVHGPDSSASANPGPEPQPVDLSGGRVVILHHIWGAESHFDLMFEHSGHLMTWRSGLALSEIGAQPVPITRIGDHRLAYLEYEGEVSGGRGRVERIERGTFEGTQLASEEW